MKKLYLLLFLAFLCFHMNAQAPTNDEPLNAYPLIVVPLGGTINSLTGTTVNATLTDTPSVPAAPSNCGCTSSTTAFPNDVWYVFNTGSFNSFELTVSSTNYIGAPGYVRIYQDISNSGTPIECFCSPFAQQAIGTVNVSNLISNTNYYIAVSPKVGTNGFWGPFEINIFGSNTPLNLSSILDLTARKINNNTNEIYWKIQTAYNIDNFILQRKDGSNSFKDIAVIAPKKSSKDYYLYDNEFVQNEVNEYRIKIISNAGEAYYSDIARALNSSNQFELVYFPNPGSNVLNISRDHNQNEAVLDIYNTLGRKVNSTNIPALVTDIKIDVEALASGLYLLYYKEFDNTKTIESKWLKK